MTVVADILTRTFLPIVIIHVANGLSSSIQGSIATDAEEDEGDDKADDGGIAVKVTRCGERLKSLPINDRWRL